MTRKSWQAASVLAWVAVGAFWYATTSDYHPTRALALIVTVSLVTAYAAASYTNHLVLVPRYARSRQRGRYAAALLATMAGWNGLALSVIRVSYRRLHGPDADPNGVYIHYAIDFFGMVVHVAAAALVVWVWQLKCDAPPAGTVTPDDHLE